MSMDLRQGVTVTKKTPYYCDEKSKNIESPLFLVAISMGNPGWYTSECGAHSLTAYTE